MEDVEEIYAEEEEHSFFLNIPGMIAQIFEVYGWYLLLLSIVGVYIYTRMRPSIEKYKKKKSDEEYAAKYHKNPDLLMDRVKQQQLLAQRLQEQYDRDAQEYKRKQEEKEAKKREELLAKYQNEAQGYKLGNDKDQPGKSSSLKPEYNPLVGGSSHSYRAPKRSACSKGGCGK